MDTPGPDLGFVFNSTPTVGAFSDNIGIHRHSIMAGIPFNLTVPRNMLILNVISANPPHPTLKTGYSFSGIGARCGEISALARQNAGSVVRKSPPSVPAHVAALPRFLIAFSSIVLASSPAPGACPGPPSVPGTTIRGPILEIPNGSEICVALTPSPSTWVEVALPPPANEPTALWTAVFAKNARCVIGPDGTGACRIEGRPLAREVQSAAANSKRVGSSAKALPLSHEKLRAQLSACPAPRARPVKKRLAMSSTK